MNKNSVIGTILIIAIFFGFMYFQQPSKEKQVREKAIKDSLELVKHNKDSIASINKNDIKDDTLESIDTTKSVIKTVIVEEDSLKKLVSEKRKSIFGKFSNASVGEKKHFVIENDYIKLKISSKGGSIDYAEIKNYKAYNGDPLILFDNDSSRFSLAEFFSEGKQISTNLLFFKPFYYDDKLSGKDSLVLNSDSLQFAMRLYPDKDTVFDESKYIEFLYTIRKDDYMLDFDINFVGMQDVIEINLNYIDVKWSADLRPQEKSFKNESDISSIYYKPFESKVTYLSETSDDEEDFNTKLKWVSFKQQFFSATLIAKNDEFVNANLKVKVNEKPEEDTAFLKSMVAEIGIPYAPSENYTYPMSFYFGPNEYLTFRKYDLELERQIPLGWSFAPLAWINRYAVIPVFNFLDGFNMNYGLIILILTLLLKLVLFPIAYKTYISSAKMRVLKPEIEEINAKFKKEDNAKKQQATMALYKKAGVNPMAGCVPMLLQMPMLIALYRFFPSSIELRQKSFLWAEDLSTYDSIISIPEIPMYGDHISLFTLLMTISTVFYTRLNNQMMSSGTQMPGMKVMMYMMPLMFMVWLNNFAAALSYYYLLANLITFAQMFLMRKFVNEDKIHLKIQANKKKPVKKSAFAKRLDDAQKQAAQRKKK